jgi:hypothetical protein
LDINDTCIQIDFILGEKWLEIHLIDVGGTLMKLVGQGRTKALRTYLGLREGQEQEEYSLDLPVEREP